MDDFNDISKHFTDWLSTCGAEISSSIKLKDLRCDNAGRGVVATVDIEEDEQLFRIPRSVILSVENSILANEIPKATFDHLGPWLSLILVMLYEYQNKEASNWYPYFRILPTEFNTLMFWEADELEALQASAVVHKIGKESADSTFKNDLVPVIKEFAGIFFSGDERCAERAERMADPENLRLMHVMGTLIMAYAFDIEPATPNKDVDEEGYASEDEDEALPKGMVPMADMLNADADRNNARLFYEEEGLVMKSIMPIKAGDEIFNDYGPLPRSDLLRRYGYITDNYAQYDVVEIPLELITQHAKQAASSDFDAKLAYLEEQGMVEEGYDIAASDPFELTESLSPEFLVLIKTLLTSDAEFERLKRKSKLPKPEGIASAEAQLLVAITRDRLAQYSTSLEQDTQELMTYPSMANATQKERRVAMAKLVRIGEKGILQATEQALSSLIPDVNDASRMDVDEVEDERPAKKQRRA